MSDQPASVEIDYPKLATELREKVFFYWHHTVPPGMAKYQSPQYLKGLEAVIAEVLSPAGINLGLELTAQFAGLINFIDYEPELSGPDDEEYAKRLTQEIGAIEALIRRAVLMVR